MGDISDLSVTPTLFRVAKGLRMVGLPSVLLYHNASNFPARVPESPFWRALKRVVDLIGIATLYHEGTLGLVNALGEPVAMRYYERAAASRWLPGAPNPWLPFSFPAARVFVLAALVAVIVRNYRVLVDQDRDAASGGSSPEAFSGSFRSASWKRRGSSPGSPESARISMDFVESPACSSRFSRLSPRMRW